MRKWRAATLLSRAGGGGPSSLLTGLGAYWALEEASGSRADATGNGNSASPTNTPGNAAGRVGNALSCVSASTQYLTVTSSTTVQSAAKFTIAGWFYLTTLATGGILAKWDGAGVAKEYRLDIPALNQLRMLVSFNGSTQTIATFTNGANWSTATWYFATGGYDGTNVWVTVNNGTRSNSAVAGTPFKGATDAVIGVADTAPSLPINGRIDELGYWQRDLTAGELTALYNSGSGITYPFTGT